MESYRDTTTGDVGVADREGAGVLGRVLGLVGFSFVFTAGGAAVGAIRGRGSSGSRSSRLSAPS